MKIVSIGGKKFIEHNGKYVKFSKQKGHLWIRLFGRQILLFKDQTMHFLLCSQRMSKKGVLQINIWNYYLEIGIEKQ